MVLEIKYVNANNAVIHTENSKLLLTGILAKISLGNGIWAKFRLGNWDLVPPFTTLLIVSVIKCKIWDIKTFYYAETTEKNNWDRNEF